jgi:L-ascorbate metabolism protein UlaG (beta-lactamase superfamily)
VRITKFGHACVRIEDGGHVLVIDPGGWTSPESVAGAHAVLITHEHADHYDADNLRATDAAIFTIEAVAAQIREHAPDLTERVSVVAPGQRFGDHLSVRVVGELHAVIHPEYDRFANSGFVVTAGDATLYHPGDALTVPGQAVDVLCAPVSAPWLKASEAIDFARAVGAPRNLAIHDGIYSDRGLATIDTHMGRFLAANGQDYSRIAEGTDF